MTVQNGARGAGAEVNTFWRIVHNCVAHPLLEILPERWGTWFHDWTARKAFPTWA
jgi:hypothetical protein